MRIRLRKLALENGIHEFRPGQEETMLHVLHGEDTLAIMPTGAGKSLCYQLPAQILSGTTIVVSPLISLMKDQHRKIQEMGFESQHLSSELTRKQTELAIRRLGEGKMDIQFVTPEKLENPAVLEAFKKADVKLFVVDEAHCISEWGHDFRPAYLGLAKAIEALGHPTVLALTATATPEVTADIRRRLNFKNDGHLIRISYRRENLLLRARDFKSDEDKYGALLKIMLRFHERTASGIIYCSSVKQTEMLTKQLEREGLRVAMYHGRMKKDERRLAQERFMTCPGVVMIATSAFGMGIDKPDVRFVVNYQIPSSIESYYQEVGRAGRDGAKSWGILFYSYKDKSLQRVLQLRKYPNLEMVTRTVETLYEIAGKKKSVSQTELEAELGKKKIEIILKALEKAGCVRLAGRTIHLIKKPTEEELAGMTVLWEERKSEDRLRLEEMVRYVHTGLCRWFYLLKYFGEELDAPCGECDNCRKHSKSAPNVTHMPLTPSGGKNFIKGDYVRHQTWGVGEVTQKIGPNLRVYFPGVGEKILRENFVQPFTSGPTTPGNKDGDKKVA